MTTSRRSRGAEDQDEDRVRRGRIIVRAMDSDRFFAKSLERKANKLGDLREKVK